MVTLQLLLLLYKNNVLLKSNLLINHTKHGSILNIYYHIEHFDTLTPGHRIMKRIFF